MGRLLVIDESINPKVAKALRERGRDSIAVVAMHLGGAKDPQVITEVFSRYPNAVLVTGDDKMPEQHPLILAEAKATVATIEPYVRSRTKWQSMCDGISEEESYKREVVQRWAHKMEEQEPQSIRRYYLTRNGVWKPIGRPTQGRLFNA